MTDFLIYDLKVAVLIAVFYMFYRLLLAHETFHRVNRLVLLLTAVASFVLPLCVITMHETVTVATPEVAVGEVQAEAAAQAEPTKPLWQVVLPILYIIGVAVTLGHTLLSIVKVWLLISRSEQHPQADGTTICVTGNAAVAPFSWMHYIVMNRSDYEAQDAAILAHERGHIRLHHSLDVVLVDLLTALQWFNPAMWMLRQDLRAIHEYEADGEVLSQGINARQYQYLLISKAAGIGGYSIANGISHSTLKNRIHMMTHKKTRSSHLLKLLALVPIVGTALALNARTVTDYVYDEPQKQQPVKKGKNAGTVKTGAINEIVVVHQAPANKATQSEPQDRPEEKEKQAENPTDKVFDVVEQMPQFPGGTAELMKYMSMNVRYPKEAHENGIQGRVIVTFVVGKDGSISDASIVRSIDPQLDAEALRVVNEMPTWTPGMQNGEPVAVKYTVPITFKLSGGPTASPAKVKDVEATTDADGNTVVKFTNQMDVLYVVNGEKMGEAKIKEIRSKDIEHIEVLKSKEAIEQYGAQGKAGVIIITTKKKDN